MYPSVRPDPDRAALTAFLARVRAFLYPRWQAWHAERACLDREVARRSGLRPVGMPERASMGMALASTAFLATALADEYGRRWTVTGGLAEDGGGLVGPDGTLRDHFWVVRKGLVLDVAADAAGGDSHTLVAEAPAGYVRTLRAADAKVALRSNGRRIARWIEEWQASRNAPFL